MQYYRNIEVENAFEGMETEEESLELLEELGKEELEQKAPAAVKVD